MVEEAPSTIAQLEETLKLFYRGDKGFKKFGSDGNKESMKRITAIILLIIPATLHAQDSEVITSRDTVTIRAMNITVDPFQFGENPLDHLQQFKPKQTYETYPNSHVEGKIDTAFTLKINDDTFAVVKWGEDETGLLAASVNSKKFKTSHGFQTGMTKKEVIAKLKAYGIKAIPRYLILENLDVYELLIFTFTGDRLTNIRFQGYLD